jgi:phosphatidate cytidylyltransferase
MSDLLGRVLVAALLAPVALGAVYLGGIAMLLLALVACALALDEFFRMARGQRPIPLTGFAAGLGMVLATWGGGIGWSLAVLAASIPVTFLVVAGVAPRESALGSVAVTTFGALYVGGGMASLVALRGLESADVDRFGWNLVLAVLLGTWASDIFAYFGGRLFGRHRLAPAISPKKTVEGFVIGLAAGVFTTWVTLYRQGFTNQQALLVGVGVALAAPLGDLFESFLKRDLGVKDSGTLLAGHGGVLDRIDALLFAGPAALAIVALLGKA